MNTGELLPELSRKQIATVLVVTILAIALTSVLVVTGVIQKGANAKVSFDENPSDGTVTITVNKIINTNTVTFSTNNEEVYIEQVNVDSVTATSEGKTITIGYQDGQKNTDIDGDGVSEDLQPGDKIYVNVTTQAKDGSSKIITVRTYTYNG